MKKIRIAYIGGGSQGWALNLMSDLALQDKLNGELVLYDINYEAARKNQQVSSDIFNRKEAIGQFDVIVERELEDALKGSDFVVISIEPGSIEMRYADLEIPAKYGILQSVGDTAGPGGIARAMRAIPIMAEFGHAIMKHCPDAWVINYTNPMSWCTAALYAAEPEIKAVGCCHEVFGTQEMIADWVAKKYGVETPARHEIKLDISGVNHFTFATAAYWEGKDLLSELAQEHRLDPAIAKANALERQKQEEWFESDHQIAFDFLHKFGALGAAGDRHLAEFVSWYLTSEAEMHNWGATLTPYEWRVKRTHTQDEGRQKFLEKELGASSEEGVQMIAALAGKGELRTQINMPNQGQNPDVPVGALVESYGLISKNRIEAQVCGELPVAIQSLVDRNITVQQLILEGVMNQDKAMILEGLRIDPLVNIPTDQMEAMFEEICQHLKIDW